MMELIFYILFMVMICRAEYLLISYYFETIMYQWFYFKLFLRCTFVVALWILHFGAESFGVEWTYKGEYHEMYLNELGE